MVDLIITDAQRVPKWPLTSYTLDLAYGSDENSFQLSDIRVRPEAGALVMIDGTEYGGRITKLNTDGSVEGPTWHGMLADRIIEPDPGQDYYVVSGSVDQCIDAVLQRIGLKGLFVSGSPTEQAETLPDVDAYQFARYVDAYTGLRAMVRSVGGKLLMREENQTVHVYGLPIQSYGDAIDSDLLEFTAQRDTLPVNHLIGLGDGELRNRIVVHRYADSGGNISDRQSITGLDERTAVYDYSSAKQDDLIKATEDKLREMQQQGGVKATLHGYGGLKFDIGDQITGRNNRLGITVTVPVSKKIVKVSHGVLSVSYECGDQATGQAVSLSGGGESGGSGSGGGASYVAGDGITIANNIISADVTQAELDAVDRTARDAQKTASDFAAQIGQAQQDAQDAVNTANQSVRTLNGTAPIHVWRSEDKASATVYADVVTSAADGMMSKADKTKLDGLENYTLPPATTGMLGGVKPDGQTVTITSDGTISAHAAGGGGGGITWPVGSIYQNTTGVNPANDFGGTWEARPSLGPYTWEKTGNGTVTPPVTHSALGTGILGSMIIGGDA